MRRLEVLILLMLLVLVGMVVGCGDDDDDDDDSGTQVDDDDDDDDDDAPVICEDTGLFVREFVDAEDDKSLYATAADFTVNTLSGEWNFKENYTGCETYLLIPDLSRQATGWDNALWSRDVEDLLDRLPDNAHVFFLSKINNDEVIAEVLAGLKEQVDAYLAVLPQDDQDRWFHRIHYITDTLNDIGGWISDIMLSPGWGVGIDRFQRIRYIGSYADRRRFDSGVGWFAPNLSMAANESIYYNYEAQREAALDPDATIVPVFDGSAVSGTFYADITLPDAETMASFDTIELDLYCGCVGDGEFGDCPEWDYLIYLWLCDEGDPDTCDTEFGRWITTYHREGRWVHDVSALLPQIADGGSRRVKFYTQNEYELKLDIRLSSKAKEIRPTENHYLFSGGSFDLVYNDQYTPIDVDIPADAVKVELATVITGHGMANPQTDNCAEFCNTTHHFYVDGTENMIDFPYIGNSDGCMDQVTDGTVPNQYGTWWYGRSGWCPGKQVPLKMTDITDQVTPGDTATFEYMGLYEGLPYDASGANIVLSSWVVISK
jgi:hypothetical protein